MGGDSLKNWVLLGDWSDTDDDTDEDEKFRCFRYVTLPHPEERKNPIPTNIWYVYST